jgi:hypothetical protein
VTGLPLDPVDDVERAASRAAGRSLADQGIPMVLALEDVTGPEPAPGATPAGPDAEAIGAALADRLRVYHALLFPAADGDAYWPVHDALVVVSDVHAPRPGQPPA